ncbi:MAG: UvrD-helicase domain-containing protein [Treponema sp.]|nr:UvrD-helicase domain-containing protein [Treponema sp.]
MSLAAETELNGPQLKAVTSLDGAILIIAGAGSGKTRVITYRIARMLEKGIPQSAILALTFTNKAAREMESRVKELAGQRLHTALPRLTVSTFHAFGVKMLREEIEVLGYRKNFSIYDSTDKIELIKEALRECKLYGEKTDLKSMEQIFSNIKIGRLQWGRPDASGRCADNLWEPAYNEYQRSLKVYNALDFDDLLTVPINLFTEHPEILEKYRRRYRYILVDEFQDTSLIQYKLLRLLAHPEGGKSNVCVVGDDDQSIYSWRGANYENLLLFEKDFPNALEIKLEQNYRSTSTILEAANGVISHNTNRKEKNLWSGNSGGKPIELSHPENESTEAAFIAGMIKKLRFAEQRNYDNFGVLVRTNNQFDVIEEAFLAESIPCKVSGGTSFFERKEIRDILSYMRTIANPDDDVNLLRIINTPRRGIGKASIQAASELAKKNRSSLYDAFSNMNFAKQRGGKSGDGEQGQEMLFLPEQIPLGHDSKTLAQRERDEKNSRHGAEDFLELIRSLRDDFFTKGSLSKKVRALADKIDYWSYLVSEHSKDEKKARWKFSNIEYLIRMIEDWEKDPDNLDPGLYAYLNRISLLTRADGDDEAGRGKVNLMTIHAAKGLEFPVVFIAGAEAGIIPHERSIEDDGGQEGSSGKAVEEERRLFYVAITRARDKLYITSCQKRRRQQSYNERTPSPFLEEIPAHLIEVREHETEAEQSENAEAFFARMRERFSD